MQMKRVDRFRKLIRAAYEVLNPAKLDEIDAMLAKYKGAEQKLYERILVHYGLLPEKPSTSAVAQPGSGSKATRRRARNGWEREEELHVPAAPGWEREEEMPAAPGWERKEENEEPVVKKGPHRR